MSWQCFILEPTGRAKRALRRYTWSADGMCPIAQFVGHSASTPIENGDLCFGENGTHWIDQNIPHDDQRWPTVCDCGYTFIDTDQWQVEAIQLWKSPDGTEYTIEGWREDSAPAGAMWDAAWFHDIPDWTGPDGLSLNVMLPDRTPWLIDGPSRSGGKWERSGISPQITARPSILSKGYHGWLTDGVLSDDLEGRTY